jgi:8-oxo-dGTP pyrophosphatase MutT (NUDIX family)
MDLQTLAERITKRLGEPLPGHLAHEPLRASAIGTTVPNFVHKTGPKPGSVIILLHEDEGKVKFPMIKRPQYLGAHSNQVSLPGGKAEIGENAIETALREAEEEIGVSRGTMRVLGTLSDFFVIPSNFMVTPVIATVSNPSFHPDSREVAKILQGDLDSLLLENAIQTKEILAANTYRMMAPHFLFEEEIVWGATAMMLNEFRMIIQDVV